MKGSDIVYNVIKKHCSSAFIYSGGAIMPLVDKFYKSPIKYYINSTEHCSALSAVGYAKSTGKVGLCITTSGPGLTNAITGMADASTDSTPMVVLSGQVATSSFGTQAFQEAPAVELTKPITKWSCQPRSVNELEIAMEYAFHTATTGKPGVVHIDLCKDLLVGQVPETDAFYKGIEEQASDYCNLQSIANTINDAERPVIILGKGAVAYAKDVREFCNNSKIPTTSTIHAMGIVDETTTLALKFLGMHGSIPANYAVQNADCVINLGSRFDDRITGNTKLFAPNAKIIHCNIAASDINKNIKSDYAFKGDVLDFINNLKPLLENKPRGEWLKMIKNWSILHPFTYKLRNPRMKQQEVICQLNKYMNKSRTILTTGVGNHQMYACQFINWTYPRRFITSGSLGAMGAGLPYAIGCQVGNPGMTVINLDGDGSFNMTLTDLRTVTQYNLPIKIIVLDDGHLSMVKVWEELFYQNRNVATDLPNNPDYCKLANAFGIESIYCDSRAKLAKTIKYILASPGPILGHFKVETDRCFPLVAPGAALDDIIMEWNEDKNISSNLPPS